MLLVHVCGSLSAGPSPNHPPPQYPPTHPFFYLPGVMGVVGVLGIQVVMTPQPQALKALGILVHIQVLGDLEKLPLLR